MGKNRKRKQRNDDRSKDISQNMKITPVTANEKSRQPYSSQSNISLPRSFPSNLSRPFNDFLRDEDPFKESFRSALNTSYEGFVVDEDIGNEGRVQNFLEQILANKLFRKDVTQPFGLGTKCALTYVTRCLLGEPGTTYKYLGLRMFAHPWKKTEVESLGKTLTERTKQHLQTLSNTRSERGSPGTKCRPKFDICLINRMESSVDLKDEPTIGNAKTSVSWHADSSLEHYSTIAVYQTLLLNNNKHQKKKEKKKKTDDDDKEGKWFVALRVAHHSEGPQSSRRGADIESSIVKNTPPIAVSLPSGSAYYLLDDFNHHHQHTVLTNGDMESAGIRYSCTYRLLRDSHNVEHMTGRCQAAISNFHKKGSKLWRSEQLLLSELENEWIRQFYIQGSQHRDLLWSVSVFRVLGKFGSLLRSLLTLYLFSFLSSTIVMEGAYTEIIAILESARA
jgi:alpha-ketoglutarate-dependent dioxygenase FTO